MPETKANDKRFTQKALNSIESPRHCVAYDNSDG